MAFFWVKIMGSDSMGDFRYLQVGLRFIAFLAVKTSFQGKKFDSFQHYFIEIQYVGSVRPRMSRMPELTLFDPKRYYWGKCGKKHLSPS